MTGNPFKGPNYNGHQTYHHAADDRIRIVKTLNAEQCQAALQLTDLQKTVERAIHSRLRTLRQVKP